MYAFTKMNEPIQFLNGLSRPEIKALGLLGVESCHYPQYRHVVQTYYDTIMPGKVSPRDIAILSLNLLSAYLAFQLDGRQAESMESLSLIIEAQYERESELRESRRV